MKPQTPEEEKYYIWGLHTGPTFEFHRSVQQVIENFPDNWEKAKKDSEWFQKCLDINAEYENKIYPAFKELYVNGKTDKFYELMKECENWCSEKWDEHYGKRLNPKAFDGTYEKEGTMIVLSGDLIGPDHPDYDKEYTGPGLEWLDNLEDA